MCPETYQDYIIKMHLRQIDLITAKAIDLSRDKFKTELVGRVMAETVIKNSPRIETS